MSEMIELLVDDAGRIRIPAEIRNRLGLAPGTTLTVEPGQNGEVWLRPDDQSAFLREEGGLLVFTGEVLGDVSDIVQQHRERRIEEIIRQAGL